MSEGKHKLVLREIHGPNLLTREKSIGLLALVVFFLGYH